MKLLERGWSEGAGSSVAVAGRSTGRWSGRSWVDTLTSSGKSFAISKWEVQEAWETVKANRGAPGVDGCSLEDFEADLKRQLSKIWNRMSSGSYFPPPVRAVEIPSRMAAERGSLGYQRSRTGSRRRWWPGGWRGRSSRSSTRTRMGIDRDGRRWTRLRCAGGAAGR